MAKTDWKDIDGTVITVTEQPTRSGYVYQVGFNYKVDDHWYGGSITTPDAYREGDSIAVRYDPQDPDRNDLSEKEKHSRWILIGVAIALVAFGALVVILSH